MTHTEESLMALVSNFVQTSCDRGFTPDVTWHEVRQEEQVLRLAIREVLADNAQLRRHIDRRAAGVDPLTNQLRERTEKAEAECERLRKEIANLDYRAAYEALEQENVQLRKDAEQLRMTLKSVKQAFTEIHHASTRPDWFTHSQEGATKHRLEWERRCIATIDAAIAQEAKP